MSRPESRPSQPATGLRPSATGVLCAAFLAATGCSEVTTQSTATEDGVTRLEAPEAVKESEDKGHISGWFNGNEVQLYYTKSYSCPPPVSEPLGCEIGDPSITGPRPGPIPTIYAIAAVGFTPDPATVACAAGSPCLNHPAMINASRVGGSATASPPSHSHILDARAGGWFRTVNIRVRSQSAWNEIAAAKTLAKVRELQGDSTVGVDGVISADTPTNIHFFIAGWH